jgi:hypothetical protein
MAFSPDSTFLASAGSDGIILWGISGSRTLRIGSVVFNYSIVIMHSSQWLVRVAKVVGDLSEWLCKFHVDPTLDPLRSDLCFDELIRLVKVDGPADTTPPRSLRSDSASEFS